MGRAFVRSSSEHADSVSNIGVTGSQNRTVMTWGKVDTNNDQGISQNGVNTNNNRYTFRYTVGGFIRVEIQGSGFTGTNSITLDVWEFVAVVFDGTQLQDNTLYLNETSESATGTNTLNTTDSLLLIADQLSINYLDGSLAIFCYWNVALSAVIMSALARGVHPFCIEHSNQVVQWNLNGHESPESDYSQNQNKATLINTPAKSSDNPPTELLENYL